MQQLIPHKVYFGQVQMCKTAFYACDLLGEQRKLLKGNKIQFGIRISILPRKNNIDRILIACTTKKPSGSLEPKYK